MKLTQGSGSFKCDFLFSVDSQSDMSVFLAWHSGAESDDRSQGTALVVEFSLRKVEWIRSFDIPCTHVVSDSKSDKIS